MQTPVLTPQGTIDRRNVKSQRCDHCFHDISPVKPAAPVPLLYWRRMFLNGEYIYRIFETKNDEIHFCRGPRHFTFYTDTGSHGDNSYFEANTSINSDSEDGDSPRDIGDDTSVGSDNPNDGRSEKLSPDAPIESEQTEMGLDEEDESGEGYDTENDVEFKVEDDEGEKVTSEDGEQHKDLPILLKLVMERVNVFLVGPSGGGKSTGVRQAAKDTALCIYETSMGPATSQWDLLGFRNPMGEYVPGILRKPYEEGGILLLDEMDNTNPSVLTALNSFFLMRKKRHFLMELLRGILILSV